VCERKKVRECERDREREQRSFRGLPAYGLRSEGSGCEVQGVRFRVKG
jgi:hypothetical protein